MCVFSHMQVADLNVCACVTMYFPRLTNHGSRVRLHRTGIKCAYVCDLCKRFPAIEILKLSIQTSLSRTGFFYLPQFAPAEKLRSLHSYVIALPSPSSPVLISHTPRSLCETEYILRRTAKLMRLQCPLHPCKF